MAARIRESLRRCVGWPGWLDPLKALWILGGFTLLRLHRDRDGAAAIPCEPGFALAGPVFDSTLNAIAFYRGTYEPVLTRLMQRLLDEGDLCVDIGANTGWFTLVAASRVGSSGRVISVEAAPGNVERLRRNVDHNGWSARVEVVSAACADRDGELRFLVNEVNDMHGRLDMPRRGEAAWWLVRRRWREIRVPAVSLPTLLAGRAPRVRFIKLDIEGAEPLVVPAILAHCTHPGLCVALESEAGRLRETLGPFEQAGFHAYDLRNDYRWLVNDAPRRARPVDFETLYARGRLADVLVSRQPLSPEALG